MAPDSKLIKTLGWSQYSFLWSFREKPPQDIQDLALQQQVLCWRTWNPLRDFNFSQKSMFSTYLLPLWSLYDNRVIKRNHLSVFVAIIYENMAPLEIPLWWMLFWSTQYSDVICGGGVVECFFAVIIFVSLQETRPGSTIDKHKTDIIWELEGAKF